MLFLFRTHILCILLEPWWMDQPALKQSTKINKTWNCDCTSQLFGIAVWWVLWLALGLWASIEMLTRCCVNAQPAVASMVEPWCSWCQVWTLHLQMVVRLVPGLCICAGASLQSMEPCGSQVHIKAVHCLSITFASSLMASARVMCRCGMMVYGVIWLIQRATCTRDNFFQK